MEKVNLVGGFMWRLLCASVLCLLSLFGSASLAEGPSVASITATSTVAPPSPPLLSSVDPYEPFNRVMFRFNDILDRVVLKPVARTWLTIVPSPVVKGLRNFFSNVDNVPTIPNDILQGNFYQGVRDTWRLVINSTVGILGFFDPATHIGLGPNKEDFGLTLAQWGYRHSGYLVVPFLGPSTTRDLIGFPIDYYFFSVYPHIHPERTRYAVYGLGVISRRAELLSYQNVMQQASLDRYVFMRDAWMQHRNWLIARNHDLGDPYLEKESAGKT